MECFISKNPNDTENIGKALGQKINDGVVIITAPDKPIRRNSRYF